MLIVYIVVTMSVLLIWQCYYRRSWDKKVRVTLNFDRDAVYAGDMARLTEVIANRKKLPIPILEVGFHAKRELVFQNGDNTNVSDFVYKRDIFAVLGWQKITRQIRVKCTKRGYYRIQEADVTTYSMITHKRYSKALDTGADLYVYSARTKVNDILVICESMLGTLQCAKHLYEDPFAFRSIREYTPQDPMKTINWKASAKTGDLMVNTFDSALTQRVMILLDIEDNGILKYENLVEESISLAATIARRLLQQGMEVGLITNVVEPEVFLPLKGGKAQMSALERKLAEYQTEDKSTPFCQVLQKNKTSKVSDTVYVFISKNSTLELQGQIEEYLGKENLGLWICPINQGDTVQREACTRKTASNLHYMIREVERV